MLQLSQILKVFCTTVLIPPEPWLDLIENEKITGADRAGLRHNFVMLPDTREKPVSKYEQIYAIVRQIPYGQVATYGQVAELANLPQQARLVGYALYQIAPSDDVPWQRVVNAKGEISHSIHREGDDYLQRSLLEQEGVLFSPEGKIDLREYRWCPTVE